MLPTEITSAELQALSGYAKASLTELEQAGVIKRDAKNVWPIDTVTKLIVHLRERGRRPADDDRSRFEKMRAAREELKLKKELGEVVFTTDFVEASDQMVFSVLNRLAPLPAQIGGQDLKLRRLVEDKIGIARDGMSRDMFKLAEELDGGTGKAKGTRDIAGDTEKAP